MTNIIIKEIEVIQCLCGRTINVRQVNDGVNIL